LYIHLFCCTYIINAGLDERAEFDERAGLSKKAE